MAELSDRDSVVEHLRRHSDGETSYVEMSRALADSGVERWVGDTTAMTLTYRDRAGECLLIEQVGGNGSPSTLGHLARPVDTLSMTVIQPELWVDAGALAVRFYAEAFGARTLHSVGDGEDIVAQLAIGDAVFWVAAAGASSERLVPRAIGGATARLLLVVDDPAAVHASAVAAGATNKSAVGHEHGWLVGRIVDPFGHEWEIGKQLNA